MSRVEELAYVVYEASDLAAWENFGVELLGMQLGQKTDDLLTLRSDDRAYRWMIEKGLSDDLVASGYAVKDNASLDELIDRIRGTGLEYEEGSPDLLARRQVDRAVIVTDPLGNRVELVTGIASAATEFASAHLVGGFVTGQGGAGHHVLLTRGVSRDDYLAFYVDLLGFKISDIILEEVAPGIVADLIFLRCNGRHHSVAFGDLPHTKRTHHFMLEVDDIRDVGAAYDRCLSAHQPLEMTLGMHPNDHMFSFYVSTPSGFAVEYGWGGLLVDDESRQVRTLDRLHSWGHHPPAHEAELLARATPTAVTHGGPAS
ncbi:MAG: VOC family protein [Dermatophilus congolensis]|nr:VOC family protein [Dermatophilus congolensis]